jgi:hypothetical protein
MLRKVRDWRFRERVVRLAVADGRVACPRYGEIDVETCYACELLEDVDEGSIRIVRCTSWSSTTATNIEAPLA